MLLLSSIKAIKQRAYLFTDEIKWDYLHYTWSKILRRFSLQFVFHTHNLQLQFIFSDFMNVLRSYSKIKLELNSKKVQLDGCKKVQLCLYLSCFARKVRLHELKFECKQIKLRWKNFQLTGKIPLELNHFRRSWGCKGIAKFFWKILGRFGQIWANLRRNLGKLKQNFGKFD